MADDRSVYTNTQPREEHTMNSDAMWGWIGGIAGCLIGLAGGIIGTYCSIKNTDGARERAFMIKSAAVLWTVGALFIALLIALPHPYRWFMWIPYSIFLPLAIIVGNRKQQSIRREEQESPNTPNKTRREK